MEIGSGGTAHGSGLPLLQLFQLEESATVNNSFAKGAAVTGPKKDEAHPAIALPEASCPSRKQLSTLTNCLTCYYSSRENSAILRKVRAVI